MLKILWREISVDKGCRQCEIVNIWNIFVFIVVPLSFMLGFDFAVSILSCSLSCIMVTLCQLTCLIFGPKMSTSPFQRAKTFFVFPLCMWLSLKLHLGLTGEYAFLVIGRIAWEAKSRSEIARAIGGLERFLEISEAKLGRSRVWSW